LIHARPATGLEAKFSMPFCAAAAILFGHPSIATFDEHHIQDPRVQALLPRVTMRVNETFDAEANLSQALVTVTLRDGRSLTERANGARGYPGRLSDDELGAKFLTCAERSIPRVAAEAALSALRDLERAPSVSPILARCMPSGPS
jgi:2-methylcitrate dehydratase PrpD